ncbi:MAG: hypothetical protein GEV08_22810 [Acidimicrobiia bacterium]|nr:hypothetical protein [Acidimicrobiia bacterium]
MSSTFFDDRDTMVGQTYYQLIHSFGPVQQDFNTNTASGDGALAFSDAKLHGTTLVNGDVDGALINGDVKESIVGDDNVGVTGDDNAVAVGAGNMVGQGKDVNLAHGDVVDVEDSYVSESALGHSFVQSNDQVAWADDGSAVSFGSGDALGAGDQKILAWGNSGNISQVQGKDNDQDQEIDNSTEVEVEESFNTDNSADWDIDESFNHISPVEIVESFKVELEAEIDASDDDVLDVG